ncbi:ABC transporter ATP-binding protein [Hamadaea sp. NPDC051192]|uniref:ABC transporter ATP-binding protein n=1 Tax=Hamadaea sp. NPDC051192 TaxID=3154940 RepID=UPI00342E0247
MATTRPRRRISARQVREAAAEAAALLWRCGSARLSAFLAMTTAVAVAPVLTAWLTKAVLDRLATTGAAVAAPAAGLVAAGLATALLPVAARFAREQVGRSASRVATDRLFAALGRQAGLRRFEDPAYQDRLRLAQDSARRLPELVDGAGSLVSGVLGLTGFLGSLLLLSPLLTVVVLGTAVPVLLAEFSLARRRSAMEWHVERFHRREFFYGHLLTGVDAAMEIRLFGIGGFLRTRMMGERERADAARRRVDARQAVVQGALKAVSAGVAGYGLWWAVTTARGGGLTVGDVSMFVAAIVGVQAALSGLTAAVTGGQARLLAFTHYVAVLRAEPDLPTVADRPAPALRRGIVLRDVWFRYSDDHPWILRGVDLTIPHGYAVALVGLNGAGKTTLVKLLCRMYDPTRGQILWDGVDLRDLSPASLRERISAVFQEHMNYDMTAAENIGLGDLTALADRPRLVGAAERAGVHERLAALPYGYDTPLTRTFILGMDSGDDGPDAETGVVLSGGQWQRLALARSLVRAGRDLMILDEPSSGLDPEAEHEVHERIREHREGHTSLLISHRLSAVRDADLVAVLADGRIAEHGPHDALLAADGTYARLFRLQAAGYQAVP